jgi:ABC-type bacteriocin/lantibiotic exporter with double-glycine peptidase domain
MTCQQERHGSSFVFPLSYFEFNSMKKFFTTGFGQLIYASRYRIILTYILSIAAAVFMMFYPYLVGTAVDGALGHNLWALAPLIAVWLSHIGLDLFRQFFDTRTFARLNSQAATELIDAQRQAGVTTSTISARVAMQAEFSSFFAYDVPGTIMYILSPLGALFMLFRFELWTGLVATAYLCLTVVFNHWLYPMSKTLHQRLNSRMEKSVEVVEAPKIEDVKTHYVGLANDNIAISDFDAKTWSRNRNHGSLHFGCGATWQCDCTQHWRSLCGNCLCATLFRWRAANSLHYAAPLTFC